ncbi:hypothetical protein U1Q18_008110 [Sarracenia purpurea var. burkii]
MKCRKGAKGPNPKPRPSMAPLTGPPPGHIAIDQNAHREGFRWPCRGIAAAKVVPSSLKSVLAKMGFCDTIGGGSGKWRKRGTPTLSGLVLPSM